ncbi:hypothetical protein BH24ACT5_BH24ACT5_06820 [soil metagenome]
MTDCTQTLHDLEAYLDGELSPEDTAHVLSHIDECLECFHAFDFQAEVKQIIAAKCGNDALPPDLLGQLRIALAPPVEPSPSDPEL